MKLRQIAEDYTEKEINEKMIEMWDTSYVESLLRRLHIASLTRIVNILQQIYFTEDAGLETEELILEAVRHFEYKEEIKEILAICEGSAENNG